MKILSLLAAVLSLGLWLTVMDAEAAKRVGGGASSGMQRNMDTPDKAPGAAPAQTPTTPSAAAATPQTPAKRSWMGPIAGLAAGLGLAALASYLGFGEEFASIMMIILLGVVVLAVVGWIMRRRAATQQPVMAGAGGMHYAAAGPASGAASHSYASGAMPVSGADAVPGDAGSAGAAPVFNARIPANFDVAGFVRQAKVNFIRLQAANDTGNLDDLREFTTPEMFAELKTSLLGRGNTTQQTDVVEINAEVLEVIEEAARDVVSVRYRGLIREDNGPAESFDEVWHLVKSRTNQDGWRLAGIQQMP